jgi:hypothetical protein
LTTWYLLFIVSRQRDISDRLAATRKILRAYAPIGYVEEASMYGVADFYNFSHIAS